MDLNVKRVLTRVLIGCGLLSIGFLGSASANHGQNQCISAGCAARTDSQFVLYDDFDAKRLDAVRWFGQESASGGPGGLELVRRINRHRHLVMMHRVSGGDVSNSGRHISRNRLRMPRETRITGMHFDVMVRRVRLSGCEVEGAADSAAKARGVMFLFNDGSSTSSGNATGDVGAVVEVYKSVSSEAARYEYHLRGFVFRCLTPGCSSTSPWLCGLGYRTKASPHNVGYAMAPGRR